jgi:predicted nucleic acid-binding Zn ribbon protein
VESLSGVLPRVFKQLGLEEGLLGWRAVHEWEQAVGPRIARHARAVAFREGVLQIEVEGSAWMHELGFLKADLMRTINRHLGSRLVKNLRFIPPRGGIPR